MSIETSNSGHEFTDGRHFTDRITENQGLTEVLGVEAIDLDTYRVQIYDSVSETDPEGKQKVNKQIDAWIQEVALSGYSRLPNSSAVNLDRVKHSNPASKQFLSLDSVRAWREQVPTAMALYPLQNPSVSHLLDKNMTPIPEEEKQWFMHTLDAVGLRSRGAVFAMLAEAHGAQGDESQRWISLASGAADPTSKAIAALKSGREINVELDLVDKDPHAIEFGKQIAHQHGLDPDFTKWIRGDLFNMPEIEEMLRKTNEETAYGQYDFVDILGFFEYLPDVDRYSKRGDKMLVPSAGTFLKGSLDLLKPGGKLVLGNMLDTHPQLPFTMSVVHWPYIVPRSLDKIRDIVDSSIDNDFTAEYYLPEDGVYAVPCITRIR